MRPRTSKAHPSKLFVRFAGVSVIGYNTWRNSARMKRKYQTALAEARQEVSAAEDNLSTAQQSKKSATAERIGLAEQRVRLARQRLREVQSAGPSTAR